MQTKFQQCANPTSSLGQSRCFRFPPVVEGGATGPWWRKWGRRAAAAVAVAAAAGCSGGMGQFRERGTGIL